MRKAEGPELQVVQPFMELGGWLRRWGAGESETMVGSRCLWENLSEPGHLVLDVRCGTVNLKKTEIPSCVWVFFSNKNNNDVRERENRTDQRRVRRFSAGCCVAGVLGVKEAVGESEVCVEGHLP